jgi:hypothetical protein
MSRMIWFEAGKECGEDAGKVMVLKHCMDSKVLERPGEQFSCGIQEVSD